MTHTVAVPPGSQLRPLLDGYARSVAARRRTTLVGVALLGVANTLIALNDSRDACQALAKLTVEFPGAAKAGVASARKRAGCGK